MNDNTRTAIGYICIALVFIAYFSMFAIISIPEEYTVNINLTSDDNSLNMIESMERIQKLAELEHGKKQYEKKIKELIE